MTMDCEPGSLLYGDTGIAAASSKTITFLFTVIASLAQTGYFACLGASVHFPVAATSRHSNNDPRQNRNCSSDLACIMVAECLCLCALLYMWFQIRPRIDYVNGLDRDETMEWVSYSKALLFGFFVEACILSMRRIYSFYLNLRGLVQRSQCATLRCFPMRLCLFLLMLSGDFLQIAEHNFARKARYEYRGPMRITRSPRAYSMERIYKYDSDLLDNFPCLREGKAEIPGSDYWNISYVQADLEIGWGKSWGCKHNTDKWNINWPQWYPCFSLICPSDGLEKTSCPCYPDQESATNSTLQCMEEAFDFSPIRAWEERSESNDNDHNSSFAFDLEQPPWEDPSWPSIERYGSCDGNTGFSVDIDYVEKGEARGKLYRTFMTLTLLVLGSILLPFCFMGRARHSIATRAVDLDSVSGQLWRRLARARAEADFETIYLGDHDATEGIEMEDHEV